MNTYDDWNFSQLQVECKRLGLSAAGAKVALIARLTDFVIAAKEPEPELAGEEPEILEEEKEESAGLPPELVDNIFEMTIGYYGEPEYIDHTENRRRAYEKALESGYMPLGGLYAARLVSLTTNHVTYELEVQ